MPVQVQGLGQLEQQLHALADWLRSPQALNLAVAQVIVREAQPRTPRRTGRLAASMEAQATGKAARPTARTPYAQPVHQGVPSRNMRAQPWLIQTAVAVQAQWSAAAVEIIDTELGKVTGK